MTKQEQWEADYRQVRYMQSLSQVELEQRYFDIFNNTVDVTSNGLFAFTGIEGVSPPNSLWLELSAHIRYEFGLRSLQIPNADRSQLRLFFSEGFDFVKAAKAVKGKQPPPPFLARYNSRRFISEMLIFGRIQLATASSYDDESLGIARRDNELQISDGSAVPLRAVSDYLVYCVTTVLKPRLFADFNYDAALIIKDPVEFWKRLCRALSKLPFDGHCDSAPITYYDPLRDDLRNAVPGFWKRFGFAYQGEWRFLYRPDDRSRPVKAEILELGSLSDISEAIFLDK